MRFRLSTFLALVAGISLGMPIGIIVDLTRGPTVIRSDQQWDRPMRFPRGLVIKDGVTVRSTAGVHGEVDVRGTLILRPTARE